MPPRFWRVSRRPRSTSRFRVRISSVSQRHRLWCSALGSRSVPVSPIYTIALRCQINVDPARRRYDADPASDCPSCSESPSGGARRPRASCGRASTCSSRASKARPTSTSRCPAATTSRSRPPDISRGLSDGAVPLSFHLSGSVFYKTSSGELRITQVPWDIDVRYELPLAVWTDMMEHHYPEEWLGALRRENPEWPFEVQGRARSGLPRRLSHGIAGERRRGAG